MAVVEKVPAQMGMLDSLKEGATKMALAAAQRMAPPDPASFNDPLALRIEWSRLSNTSSNFSTYQLAMAGDRRMALKPTVQRHAIWLVMSAAGIAIAVGAWPHAIGIGIGAAIAALGAVFLFRPKAIAFDGQRKEVHGLKSHPALPFQDIHAVQFLQHWVSGKDSSTEQGELNLVLRDGKRVHVHADSAFLEMQNGARQLAAFIGCALWDANTARKVQFGSLDDVKKFAESQKKLP